MEKTLHFHESFGREINNLKFPFTCLDPELFLLFIIPCENDSFDSPFNYKYVLFARHFLSLDILHLLYIMPSKHLPYPGQLPPFRFETEKSLKANRIRSKQIRRNIDHHRMINKISMSRSRTRKLEQFDYEAYRADFAKRYISINIIR
jgi:hypothetical protein